MFSEFLGFYKPLELQWKIIDVNLTCVTSSKTIIDLINIKKKQPKT